MLYVSNTMEGGENKDINNSAPILKVSKRKRRSKLNALLQCSKCYDRGKAITFSDEVTHKLRIEKTILKEVLRCQHS